MSAANLTQNANVLPYWQEVNEWRKRIIEDETYITGIFPGYQWRGFTPGGVSPVTREIAARHLAGGTHRLSTPEEIAAYQEDFNRRTEASKATAAAARGTTQVSLSPDSLAAILGRKKKEVTHE